MKQRQHRTLLRFLKGYGRQSVLAPLFKLMEALFDLLVPLVVAEIIDVGIAGEDTGFILRCCALLLALGVVGLLCSITAQWFAAQAAIGCASAMRRELFRHIGTLDFAQMDTIGSSTLITRLTSDINQVQNGVNMFLRLFMRSPFIVFGSVVMAFTIDWKTALVFAAAVPVLSLIVFGLMRLTNPLYRGTQNQLDRVLRLTRENLTGVRVVRAFGREAEEERQFREENQRLTALQLRVGRLSALLNPMTYVVVNLAAVAVLYVGGRQVEGGVLLSGDVYALTNYMSQILVELVKLANTIVLTSKALACAGRVQSVLDAAPEMAFPAREARPEGAEAVSFERVDLTYPGAGGESLQDITFTVRRGETFGIIGGTGSGKTSVVNLIPRFYDATGGQVRLFGRAVADYPKEQLRTLVAVVPQRAQLFTGTIRSNLLWGNGEADDAALWAALETAQAADFVRGKPLGLEEPVEQGGRNFSGGQRQRLTIARALVQKPAVLILDDSASALDFATDAALRRALRALEGEMTVVIVSQRTASLRHADQILVLEDGRQAGLGSHRELLERCEVYREIYESQFQKGGAGA